MPERLAGRDTPDVAVPLALALEQSHEVKAKVEDLAETLADTNRAVERKIAGGATTLSARTTLEDSQVHEALVLECAGDLSDVTETLAQGVNDLRDTSEELARAKAELLATQSALATAQAAVDDAEYRAMHDAATGLPNRTLFDDRVAHAIGLAERHGWSLAVMFIDLDGFKAINDTHGHVAGDATIATVASRLQSCSREEDSVRRAGGDEFLFLLVDAGAEDGILQVAKRIRDCIAEPFMHGAIELRITPSVGVAIYPRDGTNVTALVSCADAAMYMAKTGATKGPALPTAPDE